MKHKYKHKRHKFKYHKNINGNGNGNGNYKRINWRELMPHIAVVGILTIIVWGYGYIYLGLTGYGRFNIDDWTHIALSWVLFITFYLLGNELVNMWQRLERKTKPMQLQRIKCQVLSFSLGSIVIIHSAQWVVFWMMR